MHSAKAGAGSSAGRTGETLLLAKPEEKFHGYVTIEPPCPLGAEPSAHHGRSALPCARNAEVPVVSCRRTRRKRPRAGRHGAYAGIIELVTGTLIALGLFTRPAAFLASGTMAAAYWIAHAPQDFFPVNNMGDAAILYCFVFLYLVFAGPGPLSIDAAREPKR